VAEPDRPTTTFPGDDASQFHHTATPVTILDGAVTHPHRGDDVLVGSARLPAGLRFPTHIPHQYQQGVGPPLLPQPHAYPYHFGQTQHPGKPFVDTTHLHNRCSRTDGAPVWAHGGLARAANSRHYLPPPRNALRRGRLHRTWCLTLVRWWTAFTARTRHHAAPHHTYYSPHRFGLDKH